MDIEHKFETNRKLNIQLIIIISEICVSLQKKSNRAEEASVTRIFFCVSFFGKIFTHCHFEHIFLSPGVLFMFIVAGMVINPNFETIFTPSKRRCKRKNDGTTKKCILVLMVVRHSWCREKKDARQCVYGWMKKGWSKMTHSMLDNTMTKKKKKNIFFPLVIHFRFRSFRNCTWAICWIRRMCVCAPCGRKDANACNGHIITFWTIHLVLFFSIGKIFSFSFCQPPPPLEN